MAADKLEIETRQKEESDVQTQRPSFYKVILLNDDFTPMDFVVHVIMKFFQKSKDTATSLMFQVHKEGKAVVGKYTLEVAETKTTQVTEYAKKFEYPLLCSYEKD